MEVLRGASSVQYGAQGLGEQSCCAVSQVKRDYSGIWKGRESILVEPDFLRFR